VGESTRTGPSGIQERIFYPRRVRLRDLGDTFGSAIFMLVMTAFLWFSSLAKPLFIFVWALSLGYFVMSVNQLLVARPCTSS
jgi:hypothetical protein